MTQKQSAFLEAMLQCSTISKAAKMAGISPNTATKYMRDAEFQTELTKRRGECISDVVRYLQGKLSKCAEELMKIIDDPEIQPQIKINAVNSVFAFSKSMTEAEIITRLEAIETQIRERAEE